MCPVAAIHLLFSMLFSKHPAADFFPFEVVFPFGKPFLEDWATLYLHEHDPILAWSPTWWPEEELPWCMRWQCSLLVKWSRSPFQLSFSIFAFFLHYHVYPLAQRGYRKVYMQMISLNTDTTLTPTLVYLCWDVYTQSNPVVDENEGQEPWGIILLPENRPPR